MKKILSLFMSLAIVATTFSICGITAQAKTYADELRDEGFPESYITYLVELHEKYPNWTFKAYDTGLTWDNAVDGERNPHSDQRITAGSYYDKYGWLCTCSDCWDESSHSYVLKDSSYAASRTAVEYFMDPRNWLSEKYIWQFESTRAGDADQTQSGVEDILKGTWMYDSLITYNNTSGNTVYFNHSDTYSDIIMEASEYSGLSPYYIASKIKQEVGSSTSSYAGGSRGTVSPFQGIYNYFNIGAYNGANDGLAWAAGWLRVADNTTTTLYGDWENGEGVDPIKTIGSSQYMTYIDSYSGGYYKVRLYTENGSNSYTAGTVGWVKVSDLRTTYFNYGRPWINPFRAIYYGSKYIADTYGAQYTGYFQKFNVTSTNRFSHEYMVNVPSAASEASIMYTAYSSADMLDDSHTFYIPVYSNMPNEIVSVDDCSISLSCYGYYYNGNSHTPTVTVKSPSGTVLTKDTDYTLSYSSGRTEIGNYSVTVTMKGDYTGSKTIAFQVKPRNVSYFYVSPLYKGFRTYWYRQYAYQTDGYELQYSSFSDFRVYEVEDMPSWQYYARRFTGLYRGKTYYVRIRTYKYASNGDKIYSYYSSGYPVTTEA